MLKTSGRSSFGWLVSPGGITWGSPIFACWEEWVLSFTLPLAVGVGASAGAEMFLDSPHAEVWPLRSSPPGTAGSSLWTVCLDHRASVQTWGGEARGWGAKRLNFNLAQLLCHSIFLVSAFLFLDSSICESWISLSGTDTSGNSWCKGLRRGLCSFIH